MDTSQLSNSEPGDIKHYKTLLSEPPRSPPLLIDIRNNQEQRLKKLRHE